MTEKQALAQLDDAEELVTYARVSVRYGKEIVETCLGADIPVTLGRDDACTTGGCSPKVAVFVRREDVPHIARLLGTQWSAMARSEGDLDPDLQVAPAEPEAASEEPPCPACGTAAPLVGGACSDCGLVLAEPTA